MQTDPGLSIQIKLTDDVPIREIEIETAAKTPDVALSNIAAIKTFPDELTALDENFINQIKVHTSKSRIHPLNLKEEQSKDETIREVFSWLQNGRPDGSPHLPIALRKYRKQFNRLVAEDDILYRLFYDDCGNVQYRQFCVPKHLWREVVYRLHNSTTAGHFGIA